MIQRPGSLPPKRIGSRLVQADLITPKQLAEALEVQARHGGKIVQVLIELGFLSRVGFVKFLAQQGLPSVDLANYDIPDTLLKLLTREAATQYEVIPIDKLGKNLTLAMACPLDHVTIAELEASTGLRVKPVLCSAEDVRSAINRYYGVDTHTRSEDHPDNIPSYNMASLGLMPRSPVHPPGSRNAQGTVPVPPPEAISGVQGLESPLKLGGVAFLIRQIKALPTLPETVHQIQAIRQSGKGSVRDMAVALSKDPPLTAKLLQVVNSAAYGTSHKVRDIQLAASMLGMDEICNIVFSAAVIEVMGGAGQVDYRRYWDDSFRCAHMARMIAKNRDRDNPVVYFTAGLLHDIGQLALFEVVRTYPSIYNTMGGVDLCAEEERQIGLTHMEAGYLLAEHWNLPVDICNAIRFHHHPAQLLESLPPGPERDSIADIVATVSIADVLADAHRLITRDCAEGLQILHAEQGYLAELFRLGINALDASDPDL